MTVVVVDGGATKISVETAETFSQFQSRIFKARKPLQFVTKDEQGEVIGGAPIELNPESVYSFLMLELTRLATPQEFGALFTIIMTEIAKAEAQGIIPPGWVKSVATPFDVQPPVIPDKFSDQIEEGVTLKVLLSGDVGFNIIKEYPPLPEPEPVEEPEE